MPRRAVYRTRREQKDIEGGVSMEESVADPTVHCTEAVLLRTGDEKQSE